MFKPNTVFVIGAGASSEVDMPQGNDFKKALSEIIDVKYEDGFRQSSGDYRIPEALKIIIREKGNFTGDINPYLYAAWQIIGALPQAISIDNYVEAHSENHHIELMSKMGIVLSILKAEEESGLYYKAHEKEKFNFSHIENTWYVEFFKILTERLKLEELDNIFKNISIICFNYDRCIEQYLTFALEIYYGISNNEAIELVQKLRIYRPYGSVGDYPWNILNNVSFGAKINHQQLIEQSQKIQTFSEKIEENDDLKNIRKCIKEAKNIIFLGMAYHIQNLELISPQEESTKKHIYGTSFGVSQSDKAVIENNLRTNIPVKNSPIEHAITLNNLKCVDFMREYQRTFSYYG